MSSADVEEFLAQAEDVLTDWEGSGDSARWNPQVEADESDPGPLDYYQDERDYPAILDELFLARALDLVRVEMPVGPEGSPPPPVVLPSNWRTLGYTADDPGATDRDHPLQLFGRVVVSEEMLRDQVSLRSNIEAAIGYAIEHYGWQCQQRSAHWLRDLAQEQGDA